MPARLPSTGQVGVHSQRPCSQRPFTPQLLPPQSQVFMHLPLLHVLPAAHTTPAHGSSMQVPPAHTCLPWQVTAAHALDAAQVRLHAKPAPQSDAQAFTAAHLPVPGSQNCPAAHLTPLHGTSKHPATQSPSTQVC